MLECSLGKPVALSPKTWRFGLSQGPAGNVQAVERVRGDRASSRGSGGDQVRLGFRPVAIQRSYTHRRNVGVHACIGLVKGPVTKTKENPVAKEVR